MKDQTLTLQKDFARRYEASVIGRWEAEDQLLYFPARPDLIVAVEPSNADAWTGVFGKRSWGERLVTGLFTTPDDGSVCVVCSGDGYFVQAENPVAWIGVDCIPIRFVLPFPANGLLVFGHFTGFVAYRFNPKSIDVRLELAWRSARRGWDDVQVRQVTEDRIGGGAWDALRDRAIDFSLDVSTGELAGAE